MAVELLDSINPFDLPADAPAVAGYSDGLYRWSGDGWVRFATRAKLRNSVLADPSADTFDCEPGNAGPALVANAVAVKVARKEWSIPYVGQAWCGLLTPMLAGKSCPWRPATDFPAPGPYLWAADWTAPPGRVAWAPVEPLLHQYASEPTFDRSWCHPAFVSYFGLGGPAVPAPSVTPPPIHLLKGETMQIVTTATGRILIVGAAKDNGNLLVFSQPGDANPGGAWSVVDVTDALHAENPGDGRVYQVD